MIEPEVSQETLEKLRSNGWVEGKSVFGDILTMPKAQREQLIPSIADSLLQWQITSNQARTYSPMEILAVAIGENANSIAAAIRSKLVDDNTDRPKAKPIIDKNAGADVFITLPCAGYVVTEDEDAEALPKARHELIDKMMSFDYENQL
jgi:hypothetical protein